MSISKEINFLISEDLRYSIEDSQNSLNYDLKFKVSGYKIVHLLDYTQLKILQILKLINLYVIQEEDEDGLNEDFEQSIIKYEEGITADEMLFIREVVEAKIEREAEIITFEAGGE